MTLLTASRWEIVAGLALALPAEPRVRLWLAPARKRPTAEELERARRRFLVQSGRLVDGMLLDICEVRPPKESEPRAR